MSESANRPGPEKPKKESTDAPLDRRKFLGSGAAVGAVALGAVHAQPAHAATAPDWDREVDIVVIGGGAGGLVAAIAAREKGASVLSRPPTECVLSCASSAAMVVHQSWGGATTARASASLPGMRRATRRRL